MRSTWIKFYSFFLALGVMGGCTSSAPYRTNIPSLPHGKPCRFVDGQPVPPGSETCSLQHHQFLVDQTSGPQDYLLGFVEFDDQGWFHQQEKSGRQQMDALLHYLYAHDNDYLLVVYAHGWRHNANTCDENVACFRRLLEQLAFILH